MRAVCEMFWDQCKLALFMYGMFEDKQGEFRGVVCVTSPTSVLFNYS